MRSNFISNLVPSSRFRQQGRARPHCPADNLESIRTAFADATENLLLASSGLESQESAKLQAVISRGIAFCRDLRRNEHQIIFFDLPKEFSTALVALSKRQGSQKILDGLDQILSFMDRKADDPEKFLKTLSTHDSLPTEIRQAASHKLQGIMPQAGKIEVSSQDDISVGVQHMSDYRFDPKMREFVVANPVIPQDYLEVQPRTVITHEMRKFLIAQGVQGLNKILRWISEPREQQKLLEEIMSKNYPTKLQQHCHFLLSGDSDIKLTPGDSFKRAFISAR